jgi:FkbM family methyltransferase
MEEIKLPVGLTALRSLPLPKKLGLLERLFGKILATNGVCWVRASNGVKWKLDLDDPTQRWIVYGDYEGSKQMNWIRNWLSEGGLVVDSGANIGQMCLFFAALPGVRVMAFEPLPEAYEWIHECLQNYPNWNVSLNNFGLSDRGTSLTVQVWGSRTTARMDWYIDKNYKRIDIEVVSLDEFASKSNIDQVRLWKLDVEGHEISALNGAHDLLKEKRIEAILVEVSSDGVIPLLHDSGYSVYQIGNNNTLQPISNLKARGNLVALPSQ